MDSYAASDARQATAAAVVDIEEPLTRDESSSRPSRLPPRSRSGCWTCRRRKVKCDEVQPICGQCSRLREQCDYNPRLKFQQENGKLVSNMHSVSTVGCPVWTSTPYDSRPIPRTQYDTMPAFANLSTDEDRELKAAFQAPGTYYTLLIPQSFAEPVDGSEAGTSPTAQSWGGGSQGTIMSLDQSLNSSITRTSDPNVVVVNHFAEVSDRPPTRSLDGSQPYSSPQLPTQAHFGVSFNPHQPVQPMMMPSGMVINTQFPQRPIDPVGYVGVYNPPAFQSHSPQYYTPTQPLMQGFYGQPALQEMPMYGVRTPQAFPVQQQQQQHQQQHMPAPHDASAAFVPNLGVVHNYSATDEQGGMQHNYLPRSQ